MQYAIIALQGKQYKVSPGDKLTVDLLSSAVGDKIEVTDVLLVNKDGKIEVGTPLVKAKVILKVLEKGKDKKIRVAQYKAKSKYRKVYGHRQNITNVEVMSID